MERLQNLTPHNREKLSFEEVQAAGFSILSAFDEFAREHNLRYWLMYGTLLGAARHQGFIPWDDDIDICMPDDDYLRLIELAKEQPDIMGDHFRFMTWAINKRSHLPYMKLYDTNYLLVQDDLVNGKRYLKEGMFIDIFPFVGYEVEHHKKIVKSLYAPWAFLRSLIYPPEKGRKIVEAVRPILTSYAKIRGVNAFHNQLYSYLCQTTHRFDTCSHIMSLLTTDKVYDKRLFAETEYLPYGEKEFPVPAGYKEILSIEYGDDWSEIPPAEKRWCHPMHVYRVK